MINPVEKLEDRQNGPFDLGVLIENTQDSSLGAVIFSDSDFLTNEFFMVQGNKDFALQVITYLLDKPLALIIPSKKTPLPSLVLSESEWLILKLMLLIVCPLSLAIVE